MAKAHHHHCYVYIKYSHSHPLNGWNSLSGMEMVKKVKRWNAKEESSHSNPFEYCIIYINHGRRYLNWIHIIIMVCRGIYTHTATACCSIVELLQFSQIQNHHPRSLGKYCVKMDRTMGAIRTITRVDFIRSS